MYDTVAACVRLQLQNTEDKSRGTTQTCTVKSNESSLRSGHAVVVKVTKFPAKFRFCKQLGRTNRNAEGQFVTFSRYGQRTFSKSTSHFLRNS